MFRKSWRGWRWEELNSVERRRRPYFPDGIFRAGEDTPACEFRCGFCSTFYLRRYLYTVHLLLVMQYPGH